MNAETYFNIMKVLRSKYKVEFISVSEAWHDWPEKSEVEYSVYVANQLSKTFGSITELLMFITELNAPNKVGLSHRLKNVI